MGDWLPEFLPLVGRSDADESNGGDISPARVVIGEVTEKVPAVMRFDDGEESRYFLR